MPALIKALQVSKQFEKNELFVKNKLVTAVNNISLEIEKGKTIGLIGESGSGKSTFGRMLCGLENVTEGEIYFKENSITNLTLKKMKPYRKNIQMIFQSSSTIFDTFYTIGESLEEILLNNETISKAESNLRINKILEQVGLSKEYRNRYAYQLSGGEKQRVNIARALVINPEFVVCDEPVSSLDFTIRKQILNLLNNLKNNMGLTYLFITHDLSTIQYVCDSVVIMYKGKIVEYMDDISQLGKIAMHPYTSILLQSIPTTNPLNKKICMMEEKQSNLFIKKSVKGCIFADRCPQKEEKCLNKEPDLREVASGHKIACCVY
ncbi:peptide/nickel transport system ATP-binding protein [Lachnotalea glycerini]|jgi:peptide/nickel transport system ATP-binding protein|uniref:ABC transporter ATP-binding protein n=1 Tax=Lachnotalea glycerini TaxID=1763509 RepID=A0A255IEC1_9FIRM|nr:ABC transporter ATP-binding protein [Lachnotalea glycerini]PXV85724.1 peptide/nickel transport system ATP-binding protein [Lachnotalea glycerini]RDY30710.1 ABC transporter ATP-binding protein [Lachnotalea glycerini]